MIFVRLYEPLNGQYHTSKGEGDSLEDGKIKEKGAGKGEEKHWKRARGKGRTQACSREL